MILRCRIVALLLALIGVVAGFTASTADAAPSCTYDYDSATASMVDLAVDGHQADQLAGSEAAEGSAATGYVYDDALNLARTSARPTRAAGRG